MVKNNMVMKEGRWSWHAMKHVTIGELDHKTGLLRSGQHGLKCFEKWQKAVGICKDKFKIETFANGVTKVELPVESFFITESGKKIRKAITKKIKTYWPEQFTPLDIINSVMELLKSPKKSLSKGWGGRRIYDGMVSKDLNVRVVVDPHGRIITAFPTT